MFGTSPSVVFKQSTLRQMLGLQVRYFLKILWTFILFLLCQSAGPCSSSFGVINFCFHSVPAVVYQQVLFLRFMSRFMCYVIPDDPRVLPCRDPTSKLPPVQQFFQVLHLAVSD